MEHHITSLQQNPYFGLIMSALTVASVIFAVYTYFKSRRLKFLDHYEISNTLFYPSSKKNTGLHLHYNDEEIPNVTITNVAIWNAGNEAIRNTDLADAITIFFNDEEDDVDSEYSNSILDANIIGVTNQSNCIAITDQGVKKLTVDFKFLNAGDGFVLKILHTGYPFNLRVSSAVIGENKKRNRILNNRRHRMESFSYDSMRKHMKSLSTKLSILITIAFLGWVMVRLFWPEMLGGNQLEIRIVTIALAIYLVVSWASFALARSTDYYDIVPAGIKEILNQKS